MTFTRLAKWAYFVHQHHLRPRDLCKIFSTYCQVRKKIKSKKVWLSASLEFCGGSDYLPLRKDSLVTIDGVFKGEYSPLFLVNLPSALINFRLTLIEFNRWVLLIWLESEWRRNAQVRSSCFLPQLGRIIGWCSDVFRVCIFLDEKSPTS